MPRLAFLLLIASAAAAFAQAPPRGPKWKLAVPEHPDSLIVHTKLVCAVYGERNVTLDLYEPRAPGRYPAILFIHGGGWYKGDIEHDKPLAERLAVKGFVCALVDYRLSGEAPFPAALHDCKAAIRFLRANADRFHIDSSHIGTIGGSAGGHLSGLVAHTGDKPEFEGTGGNPGQSTQVQACVVMAATQDLVAAYGDKPSEHVVKFLGGTGAEKPDVYTQASPIHHVSKHSPPTLFIEGEKDTLKIGRAEMQQKLRELGIETSVHTLKDGPHPFWMSQPWLDETAGIVFEFFTQTLKPVAR